MATPVSLVTIAPIAGIAFVAKGIGPECFQQL
jgi:hypothetical protein